MTDHCPECGAWLDGRKRPSNAAAIISAIPRLTAKEHRILEVLARRRNSVIAKPVLWDCLYSDQPDDPPDMAVVNVHLCHLRKKLRGTGWRITTIWGRGYVLERDEQTEAAE